MGRVLLALSVALAFSNYSSATDQTKVTCPQVLAIGVDIGQLKDVDASDSEFEALSNLHIDGVFDLTSDGDSCVMLERLQSDAVTVTRTTKRRYVEIKSTQSGSSLTIDTYTNSGKLYSIISDLDSIDEVTGSHDAYVVERSGLRRYLGQAQISVTEL